MESYKQVVSIKLHVINGNGKSTKYKFLAHNSTAPLYDMNGKMANLNLPFIEVVNSNIPLIQWYIFFHKTY